MITALILIASLILWVAVTFLSGYIGRVNGRGNVLGLLGLAILGITIGLDYRSQS